MDDYIRCHYSSDNLECSNWFPRGEGNLCIVHRAAISTTLAGNGINKPEYIGARKTEELSLRDLIAGKTSQEACSLLDEHIAKIELIIEEQKVKYLTARAVRSEVIEGLSDEERQVRRRMKVSSPTSSEPKEKKSSKKLGNMNQDEMIQSMLKKYPQLGLAGVKTMLGIMD